MWSESVEVLNPFDVLMEKPIRIELTQSEFDLIVDKLKWMDCVVKAGDLDYEKYCNGECGKQCNRPDLCNFGEWFKSKIVER